MKPIYATGLLFLFGNEILSLLALCILGWYAVVQLWKVMPHD